MERSVLSAILASAFVICLSAHAADGLRGWSLQSATNRADCARSQVREDGKGLHISLNRADWTNPAAGWIGLEPPQGDRRIVHPDGTIRVIFRTSMPGIVRFVASLRVEDAQGEIFRFMPTRVRRVGDRSVATYAIRRFGWLGGHFAGRPHSGGTEGRNRNDKFDAPIFLKNVAFALDPGIASGELTVEAVEVLAPSGAAGEPCRLDVDTGNALHLVRQGDANPTLTLKNLSAARRRWTGVLHAQDFFGKGFDLPVSCALDPGETNRISIAPQLTKGVWRVFGELSADDGGRADLETRFAVLDAHPETPRIPRGKMFRPGIHWHAARFSPERRALCEDALVACGCKLVRTGGFAFSDIERRKGEYDWTKADAIMAETEARGISIEAIVYWPPRWSQDTNRIARIRHFKKNVVPSKEGTFGEFAQRLAARYGTKIDYYELGNEWDLVPESIMTRDEAVRLHREGYAAVKRGCPAATVMPNGWTSPEIRPDHYGPDPEFRVGGDYQEYVMSRIRDNADIYPIHMHGPFASYRSGVQKFLALRSRLGCGGIPWFSSETASSSVNGQEGNVARYVFQKIMYAWANGSVDYIWYNLVATGREESDPEQGYGMFTADMYPRDSYAAFSAFTAVYLGLALDELVADEPPVFLARFRNLPDGAKRIVVGGWNALALTPCRLRVATDARRAVAVDLMGNRRPLQIVDGVATWHLAHDPGSLILEDATFARPDAADLALNRAVSKAPLRVSQKSVDGRAPDFRMRTAELMVDYHQGIPESRHRVWKGPQDLSADVWLARDEGRIKLRVEVVDDVRAKGDSVEATFWAPGLGRRKVTVPVVSESGPARRCETVLTCGEAGLPDRVVREGLSLEVKVFEDDGEGPDGHLSEVQPLIFH